MKIAVQHDCGVFHWRVDFVGYAEHASLMKFIAIVKSERQPLIN